MTLAEGDDVPPLCSRQDRSKLSLDFMISSDLSCRHKVFPCHTVLV